MQRLMIIMLTLTVGLVLALSPSIGLAQDKTSPIQLKPTEPAPLKKPAVTPQRGKLSPPPDLVRQNAGLSLTANEDPLLPPFQGDCNCCFQQGFMPMRTVMVYIKNQGGEAGASHARLEWTNGKEPYDRKTKSISIPPIAGGAEYFVVIQLPLETFFKVSDPIRLVLDSQSELKETDETNNVVTYNFDEFYQNYPYNFNVCQ